MGLGFIFLTCWCTFRIQVTRNVPSVPKFFLPLSFDEIILSFVRKEGEQVMLGSFPPSLGCFEQPKPTRRFRSRHRYLIRPPALLNVGTLEPHTRLSQGGVLPADSLEFPSPLGFIHPTGYDLVRFRVDEEIS